MWGFAWRRNRQFVGRVCYGVKYLLWQPAQNIHEQFPESFRNAVDVMLMGTCLLFCFGIFFLLFFFVFGVVVDIVASTTSTLLPRKKIFSSLLHVTFYFLFLFLICSSLSLFLFPSLVTILSKLITNIQDLHSCLNM